MAVFAAVAAETAGAGTRSASAAYLGNRCRAVVRLQAGHEMLTLAHESKWDTDDWVTHPTRVIRPESFGEWMSEGGTFRGCHNDVKYNVVCSGFCRADAPTIATVEFSETNPWGKDTVPSWHCSLVGAAARINPFKSYCEAPLGTLRSDGIGLRSFDTVWTVNLKNLCVPEITPWFEQLCL